MYAKGVEQEERDGRRVWDLQGHDREGHGGREWQARHHHRGWGREDARWWVMMTRASDVGTYFSREGVNVDGDEDDGRVWVCEGRVVGGEDVGGEDTGGTVEDGEFVRFREVIRA